MKKVKIISVARDFSRVPAARTKESGAHSAEEFRDDILAPALLKAVIDQTPIVVDLDGTAGMCASFLDEAFGGLVLEYGFSVELLDKYMFLAATEEPKYIEDIKNYISLAYEYVLHQPKSNLKTYIAKSTRMICDCKCNEITQALMDDFKTTMMKYGNKR